MKIFSLNLSFEFMLEEPRQSYYFEPIRWGQLQQEMDQGRASERQFYVRLEPSAHILESIFDLQSSLAWRKSNSHIALILPSSVESQNFIQSFIDMFSPRLAAGGLVVNEKGEYCCIYNRGCWTLPKGHVDPGETIENAAVREVQEETGLEAVMLKDKLGQTYHTFEKKGTWYLKTTHWFHMLASSSQELTPQLDEYIEAVAWKSKSEWLSVAPQSYPLIRELFEAEFAKNL